MLEDRDSDIAATSQFPNALANRASRLLVKNIGQVAVAVIVAFDILDASMMSTHKQLMIILTFGSNHFGCIWCWLVRFGDLEQLG